MKFDLLEADSKQGANTPASGTEWEGYPGITHDLETTRLQRDEAERAMRYFTAKYDALQDKVNAGKLVPLDLWDDILDFIEQRVDIRDGSDGPLPNDAMSLMARIEVCK